MQNRYSLLDREHEPVLAACEAAGIAFLPWRPVASAASEDVKSDLPRFVIARSWD
ncbi:hypothetical protein GCM10010493_64010 [Streptomyces lavendulae subsp. grasserius]